MIKLYKQNYNIKYNLLYIFITNIKYELNRKITVKKKHKQKHNIKYKQ